MRFLAVDDKISTATFELHNAMTVTGVAYLDDSRVESSRNAQDFTVKVTLDPPMVKGSTREIVIRYEGKLTGQEESPVYGIQFHPEVYHTTEGTQLLHNFVVDICGCKQN